MANSVFGYFHKVFSPSTYPCQLCEITYHNFGKRKEWNAFLEKTEHNFKFAYINEFEKQYSERPAYPIVYEIKDGKLKTLLRKEQIEKFDTLKDFIAFFEKK